MSLSHKGPVLISGDGTPPVLHNVSNITFFSVPGIEIGPFTY